MARRQRTPSAQASETPPVHQSSDSPAPPGVPLSRVRRAAVGRALTRFLVALDAYIAATGEQRNRESILTAVCIDLLNDAADRIAERAKAR